MVGVWGSGAFHIGGTRWKVGSRGRAIRGCGVKPWGARTGREDGSCRRRGGRAGRHWTQRRPLAILYSV